MTVLLACPTYRLERETVESLLALRAQGQAVDLWIGTDNPHPVTPDAGAKNMLHQLSRARRVFLQEEYEALMIVESDVIPPPYALDRLSQVLEEGADVAYGVYRLRYRDRPGEPTCVNVLHRLSPEPGGCKGVGSPMPPESLQSSPVVPVSGSGLGCILISRKVVEEIPFRWEGVAHPDHYFTRDVWREGFDQRADLRVRCGHKTPAGQILWPEQNEKAHA